MSAAGRLQQKIRNAIPLSDAMQFSITSLDLDSIRVVAPLPPNVNIHGTGFAGSLYSLAVLTGWALCMHILEELELDADLVVGQAEIRYRAPVTGDIECACASDAARRAAFEQGVRERGRGKIVLDVSVGNPPHALLSAIYVAIANQA